MSCIYIVLSCVSNHFQRSFYHFIFSNTPWSEKTALSKSQKSLRSFKGIKLLLAHFLGYKTFKVSTYLLEEVCDIECLAVYGFVYNYL